MWVMLPMPPVPETVMVFPLVLMVTCWVPLKDIVPVVPPTVSPIVQPWVFIVKVAVLEKVRVAADFTVTALKSLSFSDVGEMVVLEIKSLSAQGEGLVQV